MFSNIFLVLCFVISATYLVIVVVASDDKIGRLEDYVAVQNEFDGNQSNLCVN